MQKIKNYKPKSILNKIIKIVLLTLLLVVSYFLSFKVDGFYRTNLKGISIIVFSILGFALFFIIYFIFKLFYVLSYNKKRKKLAQNTINCDDELALTMQNNDYHFKYDRKKGVKENFLNATTIIKNLVKEISTKYSKGGKFYYIKYTVYDALSVLENAIDGIHNKIDGYFKFFKLQDKPLTFVEKYLTNLLNEEEIEEAVEEKKGFFGSVKEKISKGAIKVGFFFIKAKVEGAVNDIISFVGAEAYRVYSKDNLVKNTIKSEDKV